MLLEHAEVEVNHRRVEVGRRIIKFVKRVGGRLIPVSFDPLDNTALGERRPADDEEVEGAAE